MTPEQIEAMQKAMGGIFDNVMEEKLAPFISAETAKQVSEVVKNLRVQAALTGRDITGLTDKQKKDFVEYARFATGMTDKVDTKANEALIEEQDNRGGYLVAQEVADAIVRIAASVGTIMSQATKWPMNTDELGIPNYTGSFLTGEYLNVDSAGSVTGLQFGQAALIAKKWQLAFAVGNDLMADTSVQLGEWLLALAGEALANMIDQQGFNGTAPFLGILQNPNCTQFTLSSGKTKFSNTNEGTPDGYQVLIDSSDMIANLEESILDGAAFYMHRTVWAKLRTQKDGAGNYILGANLGQPSMNLVNNIPGGGPIKPAGEILGYPVYTNRWMTALTSGNPATVSTKFLAFGNFKAYAFGRRGEMSLDKFTSGTFAGKEIALSDQKGIVVKDRHALVLALPAAVIVAKTAAS